MQDSIKNKPWFLLLMPVFLFLNIEKEYFRLIDYTNVAADVAWLLTSTAIIIVLPLIIFGYNQRSWLIAFFSLVFFYFLGPVKDWLHNSYGHVFISTYTFFLPVALSLLVLITLYLYRTKNRLNRIILFLNILLLVFIVVDLSSIFLNAVSRNKNEKNLEDINLNVKIPEEQKPDIYYIVFDMYSSFAALREQFNFDNSEIENFLESKGFRIPEYSESNYNLTPFSVGSTMDMDYISDLDTSKEFNQELYFPGFTLVAENRLFPVLEKFGYSIKNYSSFNIKGYPRLNESYDIWETEMIINKHNLLKKINKDIGWKFTSRGENEYLNSQYQNVARHDSIVLNKLLSGNPGNKPIFTYAHFFKPHPPYTHDSSGRKKTFTFTYDLENEKQLYIDQIKYVNNLIKRITLSIFTKSKRPYIIIFQGDHGFRYRGDPSHAEKVFQNLTCIYFPDKNYNMINEEFSSVNTFRIVLNNYFNQNLKLLRHRKVFLKTRYP